MNSLLLSNLGNSRKPRLKRVSSSSRGGRGGFTLVELMVVIAIIAVLAAIILPVYSRAREQARQTVCRANLHAIATAVMLYLTNEGSFPPPYDPYAGTGGVTQLYLSGYLTSNDVLRCPDDFTSLEDYNDAHASLAGWVDWDEATFNERYSSYNEYFTTTTYADPVYNYYGYRGYDGCTGTSTNGNFPAEPAGTSWGPTDVLAGINDPDDWYIYVYRDSNHPNYAELTGDAVGRVFDRPGAATNDYARPLMGGAAGSSYTAYFPGLMNSNAPDNTIVTHCPWHRGWYGTSQEQDLAVRLAGDVDAVLVHSYDWVAQPSY